MTKAILKEDILPMSRDKTPYGRKGEWVVVIREYEGKDGPFCAVKKEGSKDGFPVPKSKLNILNG